MKTRTFTVLFIEQYDEANGVVMTDDDARRELVDNLQDVYDNTDVFLPGNFLVVKVEDGDEEFWKEWNERIESTTGS